MDSPSNLWVLSTHTNEGPVEAFKILTKMGRGGQAVLAICDEEILKISGRYLDSCLSNGKRTGFIILL